MHGRASLLNLISCSDRLSAPTFFEHSALRHEFTDEARFFFFFDGAQHIDIRQSRPPAIPCFLAPPPSGKLLRIVTQ